MFGFFKGKKEQNNKDNVTIVTGLTATKSARVSTERLANKYAKPDTYTGNRTLYDNGAAKRQAKQDLFQQNKVVRDPYTGKELVLTISEAKARYGNDWQKHLAESDHVKPLERVYNDTKSDPWLTTDNIRDAANSSDNISVTSRHFNNPKRSRTNKEYVEDKEYLKSKGVELTEGGKERAIRDGNTAERSIQRQLNISKTKNFFTEGHNAGEEAAKATAENAITMSGIMNIVAVIKGEKEANEAIADTIKDGGKAAVTGYCMGGGLTVAAHSLSESSSPFVKTLNEYNIPGKVITAVMVTGDTLKRYANGEITTQECIVDLGSKGISFATAGTSMTIGQTLIPIPVVGAAIGALVGSVIINQYSEGILNDLKRRELEHQERLYLIKEYEMASEQARAFRQELESYLEQYFREYKDCFDEALGDIKHSFTAGNSDGVIAGANKITRKLGGKVDYENVDQYIDFINDGGIDVF